MADRSYGAVGSSTQSHNGLVDAADEERAALLNKSDTSDTFLSHFRTYTLQRVDRSRADLVLLAGYIITGILDSSSIFVWGSFVSMQTGNTVYLSMGLVAPHESDRWIRAGISIGSFCLGSAFFAAYRRTFGDRLRWVIVSSYFLQLLCVLVGALVVTLGPSTNSSDPITVWVALPLALSAFQSAGQAVESRALDYNSLTGVVLTSVYCDLFSDQHLFGNIRNNVNRNRRAAAPILLLVGAVIGGTLAHRSPGISGALWTAVILKFLIVVVWIFWPAERTRSV